MIDQGLSGQRQLSLSLLRKWMGIRCALAMKLDAELLATQAWERNRRREENEEEADETRWKSTVWDVLLKFCDFREDFGNTWIHNVKSLWLWYKKKLLSLCILVWAYPTNTFLCTWSWWQTLYLMEIDVFLIMIINWSTIATSKPNMYIVHK